MNGIDWPTRTRLDQFEEAAKSLGRLQDRAVTQGEVDGWQLDMAFENMLEARHVVERDLTTNPTTSDSSATPPIETAEQRANHLGDEIECLGWRVWDLCPITGNPDKGYKGEARHPDGSIRRVIYAPNKLDAAIDLHDLVQTAERRRMVRAVRDVTP